MTENRRLDAVSVSTLCRAVRESAVGDEQGLIRALTDLPAADLELAVERVLRAVQIHGRRLLDAAGRRTAAAERINQQYSSQRPSGVMPHLDLDDQS